MAQNKTTQNEASVTGFINGVTHEGKRDDSFKIVELVEKQTGLPAKMWGPAIIGFGSYVYKYESGREGNAPLIGFSPRANAISLYINTDFAGCDEIMTKLGKYTKSKACIYVKKLTDIDTEVLKTLVSESVKYMRQQYK